MNFTSEAFKAWCAAWLDTEGYLGYKSRGDVRIQITQTDIRPLLIIQKEYGGSMGNPDPNKRPHIWRLSLGAKDTIRFLQDVMPYLIVKRDKAEQVLALYASRIMSP